MARKPKGAIDPVARVKTSVGKMLTPEQIAGSGTEHGHQAAIMQWVATVWRHPLGRLIFAVPNGGDRQAHVGASMAAEGVRKGVPDLCWPIVRAAPEMGLGISIDGSMGQAYPGLYIELKIPGRETKKDGGCSPEQVKWHEDLLEQGYAVAVAYGWQAACWVLGLYESGALRLSVDETTGKVGVLKATPVENPPAVIVTDDKDVA